MVLAILVADQGHSLLIANLRSALKELATKIMPKVYEHGSLKEWAAARLQNHARQQSPLQRDTNARPRRNTGTIILPFHQKHKETNQRDCHSDESDQSPNQR